MLKSYVEESITFIQSQTEERPGIAIILGSGLGPFADELRNKTVIETASIPHYPVSTVEGHAGKWVFGEIEDKKILAVQGRVHVYEGYTLPQVTYPVHLMAELGVQYLIVTNAAGGLNPKFSPGDLMLIADHINLMFDNPLSGPNDQSLGPRFPDMSEPYSRQLMDLVEKTALELGIKLQEGVLAASKGPTYESAAEIRMMQRLGGDAGTMSTVPEVITAVYRGLKVLGISCITNMATGLSHKKLSHDEVTEVADLVKEKFSRLLKAVIRKMAVK
ncbi:MAG: purine-nucleoside phosphorylase [bacterium]